MSGTIEIECINCRQKLGYEADHISQPEGERPNCVHCGMDPLTKPASEYEEEITAGQIVRNIVIAVVVIGAVIAIAIASESGSSGSSSGIAPVIVPGGSSSSSYSPSSRSGSYGSRYRSSGGPSRGK